MGGGLLRLLETIGEQGSVAGAARHMGLSYAKACRILTRLEREMGRRLVCRHKGGNSRGGAELTPEGRQLAADFRRMLEAVEACAERAFRRFRRRWARTISGRNGGGV